MSIYILEARRKKSKNVNHIDTKTMSVGSKSVSDADDDDDDDDDDIKDERQEDTHRDEGYLMEEVMTNTAQLVKQIARLRVVPHFSSGMVERAKRERA